MAGSRSRLRACRYRTRRSMLLASVLSSHRMKHRTSTALETAQLKTLRKTLSRLTLTVSSKSNKSWPQARLNRMAIKSRSPRSPRWPPGLSLHSRQVVWIRRHRSELNQAGKSSPSQSPWLNSQSRHFPRRKKIHRRRRNLSKSLQSRVGQSSKSNKSKARQ